MLTAQDEQLVGYARRVLALNDEVVLRMTATGTTGELRLGVPCDLLHMHVPNVVREFS